MMPPVPPLALFDVGGIEMIVIMLLVLIFFGGEKLPGFARGAGKAIREFKKAASGVEEELKRAMAEPPPPRPTYVPPADPTPGHQIMEHPLPVEPAADGTAPAAITAGMPHAPAETSAPTSDISAPPTEIPAASATDAKPAAPKLEPAPAEKPVG